MELGAVSKLGYLAAAVVCAAVVSCKDWPSGECLRCQNECPGNLVCVDRRCVDPDGTSMCPSDSDSDGIQSTTSTTGTGGSGDNCPPPDECEPIIVTESSLFVDCSKDTFSVQLQAGCRCQDEPRAALWHLTDSTTPELALSDEGRLSGTPPPGTYHFRASADLLLKSPSREFELTVSECFAFFVEDDAATSLPRVTAARLGSESRLVLAPPSDAAIVSSYDVAPEGTYAAQVITIDGHDQLQVFRIERAKVTDIDLEHTGDHIAHAFSPDSHRLALVTASGDPDAEAELQLFDLSDPSGPVDTTTIVYEAGLTWLDNDTIIHFGSRTRLTQHVALEHPVVDGTIQDEWENVLSDSRGDRFLRFEVTSGGYIVVYARRLVNIDRSGASAEHVNVEAVAPNLQWLASDDVVGVRIDEPSNDPTEHQPFATAAECSILRGWSADGSSFLCTEPSSQGSGIWIYQLTGQRGALEGTRLHVAGGYELPAADRAKRARVVLSSHGSWLGLVPDYESGLFLVRRQDFASPELLSATLPAVSQSNYDWDFFFTSDERQMVVQQGRHLLVATLDDAAVPEFQLIDEIRLPSVLPCSTSWFPSTNEWCGAPRFDGNLLLSRSQRHIAFADDQGLVWALDLKKQPFWPQQLGTLSTACTAECTKHCLARCIQNQ